eukprot:4801506-Amphidinium_carterae.1
MLYFADARGSSPLFYSVSSTPSPKILHALGRQGPDESVLSRSLVATLPTPADAPPYPEPCRV